MRNDHTETLPCPFGELATDLSDSELRETAYEILVGACLSCGGKKSNNNVTKSEKGASTSHTSLTSRAASKMKKALGLRSRRKSSGNKHGKDRVKKASSIEETLRVQLRVSEQTDSIVRKALSKFAANQTIESLVLPLEMLQQLQPSDFPNQEEYEAWQRRNLKLLEAGLLLHPLIPLNNKDTAPQQLRKVIDGVSENPFNTVTINELMQALRSIVTSLACRSRDDGSISDNSNWANGFPLNLKIYKMLLEACFDQNDETSVVEELDEVLELIKKTWLVLGLNQTLHNLSFLWILFNRYTSTEHAEGDLLNAADKMLVRVENDAKALKGDANYAKMLSSTLSAISGWAEKRLVVYHSCFRRDNTESMACVVSMAVLSAKIMAEEDGVEGNGNDVGYERVDGYIKSSLCAAFSQASSQYLSLIFYFVPVYE
ncbi:protein unc-13 homolog [Hibiscus syriacus]|uniref:protein unc-13 homolog n=1 Tax=Hibiscus syriacus TaxID=106335 RepID=UPI001922A4CE|nr:protein unc-13 homolog [Hibiscus syriacus]